MICQTDKALYWKLTQKMVQINLLLFNSTFAVYFILRQQGKRRKDQHLERSIFSAQWKNYEVVHPWTIYLQLCFSPHALWVSNELSELGENFRLPSVTSPSAWKIEGLRERKRKRRFVSISISVILTQHSNTWPESWNRKMSWRVEKRHAESVLLCAALISFLSEYEKISQLTAQQYLTPLLVQQIPRPIDSIIDSTA